MQAYIYLRRVRYTPLNWAGATAGTWGQYGAANGGPVIFAGVTGVSMTSMFGSLNSITSSMVQVASASINAAAALAPTGRRHAERRLMQLGPNINAAGQAIPSDTSASSEAAYYNETMAIQGAVAAAVGQAVGIPASSVLVAVTGHTVTGLLLVSGVSFNTYMTNPGISKNLTDSIGLFTIPTPGSVFLTAVYDATVPSNWNLSAPLLAAPPAGYSFSKPGVLVQYIVDGYDCADVGTSTWYSQQRVNGQALLCNDAGMAAAGADAVSVNTVSAAALKTPATKIGPVAVPGGLSILEVTIPPVANAAGPLVSAKVSVNMAAQAVSPSSINSLTSAPPLTGPVLQAAFDNALNSGLIQTAIQNAQIAYMQGTAAGRKLLQAGGVSALVTAPTNAQTARYIAAQLSITTGSDGSTTISAALQTPAPAASNCVSFSGSSLQAYFGTSIAFIVAFGLLLAVVVLHALRMTPRAVAPAMNTKWTEGKAADIVHPQPL